MQVVNFGQIICGLVGEDPLIAQDAIKLIDIEYEELKPIITIEVSKIIDNYWVPISLIFVNIILLS